MVHSVLGSGAPCALAGAQRPLWSPPAGEQPSRWPMADKPDQQHLLCQAAQCLVQAAACFQQASSFQPVEQLALPTGRVAHCVGSGMHGLFSKAAPPAPRAWGAGAASTGVEGGCAPEHLQLGRGRAPAWDPQPHGVPSEQVARADPRVHPRPSEAPQRRRPGRLRSPPGRRRSPSSGERRRPWSLELSPPAAAARRGTSPLSLRLARAAATRHAAPRRRRARCSSEVATRQPARNVDGVARWRKPVGRPPTLALRMAHAQPAAPCRVRGGVRRTSAGGGVRRTSAAGRSPTKNCASACSPFSATAAMEGSMLERMATHACATWPRIWEWNPTECSSWRRLRARGASFVLRSSRRIPQLERGNMCVLLAATASKWTWADRWRTCAAATTSSWSAAMIRATAQPRRESPSRNAGLCAAPTGPAGRRHTAWQQHGHHGSPPPQCTSHAKNVFVSCRSSSRWPHQPQHGGARITHAAAESGCSSGVGCTVPILLASALGRVISEN